jgi:mannitol/fructose-specific phosphotransferase system IIA component (Ntr-type)/Kef-type K+ transport system membrane component KefB
VHSGDNIGMNFESLYLQIGLIGLLILAAHFGGRITRKLRVGEVVGQILAGIIIGPILFLLVQNHLPHYLENIQSLLFLIFIFLSIIAFGVGEEITRENIKHMGKDALIICFIQAFFTWIVVSLAFLILGFKPIIALIIGSIGIATASGTTFIIMNKLDITGRIRSILGGIVILDDVIEVIVFSILCQVALQMNKGGTSGLLGYVIPVSRDFFFAFLIGLTIFAAIRIVTTRKWLRMPGGEIQGVVIRGPELLSRLFSEMPGPSVEIFIMITGFVSLGVALALYLHLPFLMTAVIAGVLIANFYTKDIFQSLRIEGATSIFTLIFFALVGANARLDAFRLDNLLFVLVYFTARLGGKIGGNWLGCWITHQDKRITHSLPKLMLPQTGVAAVEAYFVATVLGKDGEQILYIILPALIIFDIVGITLSEKTLIKWRSWLTGGGELISEEETVKQMVEKEKLSPADFLRIECLRVPFKVNSKGEAIWQLIRAIQSAGFIQNPGKVLEIILQRERQGGTTIGNGIAILHGRLPELVEPAVAMGILPADQKVVFGGSADEPVDIVYMVLSPASKPGIHLQVLSAIARLLSNEETRNKLREARDEYEAMNIIRKYSKE